MKQLTAKLKSRGTTAAVLTLALGAAVYLNWSFSRGAPPSLLVSDTAADAVETAAAAPVTDPLAVEAAAGAEDAEAAAVDDADKNYGEAQLVSVNQDSGTEFFESARLTRSKARDEALDTLKKSLKDAGLTKEEKDALTLAIAQAKAEGADLVLGTDPDCDRVGIAVRDGDDYVLFTGNQTGALLVQFVLTMKKAQLNEKSTLVKTIVTSDLGANIGRSFGLQIEETLTGFKYIGDKINTYEQTGDKEFVIGYEESYGYLVGTHARDKDAVVSAMLICQMAAWYKNQGKTLVDALNAVYEEYGYYLDALDSFVLKGKDGAEKIGALMQTFRAGGDQMFAGVERVQDFAKGIGDLPKENVLKFLFADGSWLAVRPSGTEPKIKVYYSIVDPDKAAAHSRLAALQAQIKEMIGE